MTQLDTLDKIHPDLISGVPDDWALFRYSGGYTEIFKATSVGSRDL